MNFIEEAPKWNLQAAFYMAVKNNLIDNIETLLTNYGFDVDTKFGVHEQPAVTLAVECGHAEAVKCLLSHSCSVNQTDDNGETPLHRAVVNKRLDLMRLLLAERAKSDIKNKSAGATPFHLAVESGRLDVLQTLSLAVDKDDGVRRADNRGVTPLLSACAKGFDGFVYHLLTQCNADVRARDAQLGNGPLHYMLKLNQFTLDLLLNHGACCNARNFAGLTSLHLVAMSRDIRPVGEETDTYNKIKLLIKRGAILEARDKHFWRTPLHLAVMYGNIWCAKLFVKLGANVETKDRQGKSPIYFAAKTNDWELIKFMLISSGARLCNERWIFYPTQADDEILPETLEFFRAYRSQLPHSLKFLVRSVLRRSLDDNQIRQLAIPAQLHSYMLLNDF